MRQDAKVAQLAALLVLVAPVGTKSGGSARFLPPDVTGVSDIAYPVDGVAGGLVTLAVNLTASGRVQGMEVVRDIPSLTAAATTVVNGWTFAPAKLNGNVVPSTINVDVVFNPVSLLSGRTMPVPSVAQTLVPSGYVPPEISAASYPDYPAVSVTTGAVVLAVAVGKRGNIENVRTIRGVPSSIAPVTVALNSWTFKPATFSGKRVTGKLVVAVVFRSVTP